MLEKAESGVEKSNSRQFASLRNRNANKPTQPTISTSTIRRVIDIRLRSDRPVGLVLENTWGGLVEPKAISDRTAIAMDPKWLKPIRFSIATESTPAGFASPCGTLFRRQKDRPRQLIAANATTQTLWGTEARVLMTPIRGEPVMAMVPDASSRSLASWLSKPSIRLVL
jgi:hypothetical protein